MRKLVSGRQTQRGGGGMKADEDGGILGAKTGL